MDGQQIKFLPWKAESSQGLDSHLLLASLCFSDDQLRTYPWSLRTGTKEPAELLSCATILELWGFYCHSSVTSVVQNLIVVSSGCLGSIIFNMSVSDEETGLLRAQVDLPKATLWCSWFAGCPSQWNPPVFPPRSCALCPSAHWSSETPVLGDF